MNEVDVPEQTLKSTAENLTEHVADYVETYVQLTTVKVTEKATEVATLSFTAVLISFFGMIVMIFLGLGLVEVFSETMSHKVSYFMVTLIYGVLGAVLIGFRKQIVFPILRNKIISKIYGSKDQNI